MMLRRPIALAAALLLAGCATTTPSVPSATVGGVPDDQTSVAPSQAAALRRAKGIKPCPSSNLAATAVDRGLPALTLKCLGGDSSVNLAGLPTGRPRIINIWAQWCTPCAQESSYLGEAYATLGSRVDFLGIDYSDPATGKAVVFASRHGMTFPHVVDPQMKSRVGVMKGTAIPQTLFVDANGRIVHREGTLTSTQQVLDLARQYLEVK